jgi:hypothetical protein
MTCMTAFAEAMAMPTTQLTCAIQYEDADSWRLESNAKRKSLRMSWVVVTDSHGRRQLRIQWESRMESRGSISGRNCNVLLTEQVDTGEFYSPA